MSKIRMIAALGAASLVVIGTGTACRKFAKDKTPVLANVAGEKITEAQLKSAAQSLTQDSKKAEDLMNTPALKDQRNEFLQSLAMQKAILRYGKIEGLEKDPRAKIMLEQAQARAYFQVLLDRRIPKGDPTDAQLKAVYDEIVAQRKAAGQDKDLPPFEAVKSALPNTWRQKQEQTATESLLKDVKQRFPITFANGYKPAEQ